MKECFDRAGVKTAEWCRATEFKSQFKFPIVVKHNYGSRGTGNFKIDDQKQWDKWKAGRNLSEYICESYKSFVREYRLHVTHKGCFYTCRKMLKEGTPKEEKWHRHDENSVWILETNSEFNKPTNWKQIEKDCIAALNTVGLDVASFDVKVQGKEHKNPEYIIIECNSASSFGEITEQKYREILPQLIKEKYETRN